MLYCIWSLHFVAFLLCLSLISIISSASSYWNTCFCIIANPTLTYASILIQNAKLWYDSQTYYLTLSSRSAANITCFTYDKTRVKILVVNSSLLCSWQVNPVTWSAIINDFIISVYLFPFLTSSYLHSK